MNKSNFEAYKRTMQSSRPSTFDHTDFSSFIPTGGPVYVKKVCGGHLWAEDGEIQGEVVQVHYLLDHYYNGELQFVPEDEFSYQNAHEIVYPDGRTLIHGRLEAEA